MISVFPKGLKTARSNKLENITLRGFGGGWNAIETDMQMESSYLPTARNFRRTAGGTQKVRYGSRWLADISNLIINLVAVNDRIVDMEYFAGHLICATALGRVVAVDEDGVKTLIWSNAIANALPGTPSGWEPVLWVNNHVYGFGTLIISPETGALYSCAVTHTSAAAGTFTADFAAHPTYWVLSSGLDSIDFVPFKHELILHNGVNKPITISGALVTTYLQDLASGSNVNTPIGKYGCVVQNYHCVAGIHAVPTQIYVSAIGTAGTFPSDPIPNDSITIDVGAYAPQGAIDIRGIAGFRGNLLVFFQDQTVVVRLGTYDSGTHVPSFPDAMPTFGLLGHRCIVPIENDLVFAGLSGMSNARRSLITVASNASLEGQTISERIEPAYKETIGSMTDDQLLKECWMVFDALGHDVLLFTPTGRTFVYSFNPKLRYAAWSEYSDLNMQCGCKSFLGRVFYADGLRVYQHGNTTFANEAFVKDRVLDRDVAWGNGVGFAADTLAFDSVSGNVYKCLLPHVSSALPGTFATDRSKVPALWELYTGIDFTFEMELPWLDSKDPMRVKFLRFMSMATKGDAEFTVSAYVDNLFKDRYGNVVFDPALSMSFIGNEALGFGYERPVPTGPYGGGRRSDDPRLFKFPVKFKKLKLTLHGLMGGDLEIVNMSFLFSRGRYKR